MRLASRSMSWLLILALGWARAAAAADPPPAAEPAVPESGVEDDLRDPEALAELRRAADFLTALPRFHFRASVSYDVIQEDGRRLQFEKHGDIYLQRPDRFFAEMRLDDGRWRQVWYDGKTLGLAERSKNVHARVKAPPTIDAVLDMLEALFKEPLPVADLLYNDLGPLEQRAREADVVGESLVGGRPCLHLAFRGETVDWQLWVEQGATPFIRKLVISYREEPGVPQAVAAIDLWETPEGFGDDRFTFAAPDGSQEITVLVPMPRKIEEGGKP